MLTVEIQERDPHVHNLVKETTDHRNTSEDVNKLRKMLVDMINANWKLCNKATHRLVSFYSGHVDPLSYGSRFTIKMFCYLFTKRCTKANNYSFSAPEFVSSSATLTLPNMAMTDSMYTVGKLTGRLLFTFSFILDENKYRKVLVDVIIVMNLLPAVTLATLKPLLIPSLKFWRNGLMKYFATKQPVN